MRNIICNRKFHTERKTIEIELKIRHCGLCTAATEIQLFLMTTTNFLIGQGNFHIFKRNLTTSGQSALPEKKWGGKNPMPKSQRKNCCVIKSRP